MGPVSLVVEKSPRASPPRYSLCDSCPLYSEMLPWDGPHDRSSEGCCCTLEVEASPPVGPCFHGSTRGHHARGTRTTNNAYIQAWCINSCTARDPPSCSRYLLSSRLLEETSEDSHERHSDLRLSTKHKARLEPKWTESLLLGEVLGSRHPPRHHPYSIVSTGE